MNNIKRNGWRVAAVLAGLMLAVSVWGASTTHADEISRAENYIGRKIYIDSEEYRSLGGGKGGFVFFEDEYRQTRSGQSFILEILHYKASQNSFFLIAEGHRDQYGHSDWMLVLDAKDIPKGMQFIGYPHEDQCVAKEYPTDLIFVTGKWVNRKTKNGDYAGGYAQPIKKAWRVDFTAKKLVEIPPHGIKCENNTQPGEID
jgi:hypothetical protein